MSNLFYLIRIYVAHSIQFEFMLLIPFNSIDDHGLSKKKRKNLMKSGKKLGIFYIQRSF